jgi:hypothetical protein
VSVTDEFGVPLEAAYVSVEPKDLKQRTFVTDDRGQLRVYDLPPGDYYLAATLRRLGPAAVDARHSSTTRNVVYLPTFYPGTMSVNGARPVALGLGQEVSVRIPIVAVPVARINGHVAGPDGSPRTNGGLALSPAARNRRGVARSAVLSETGFAFSNVPPGEYLIESYPIRDAPPSDEYGALAVTVSGTDISDLVVTTNKAATVKGQIVIETGPVPRDLKRGVFSLRLTGLDGYAVAVIDLEDDGTFTTFESPTNLATRCPASPYALPVRT